jgi:hypothetical protein
MWSLAIRRWGTYVRYVDWVSTLTDARLDSLYQADGFGGEKTMRPRGDS